MAKKTFVKHDWQTKIIAQAWKDPQFKKKLYANPKEALKSIGCNVPENIQINVIEDQDNSWTLVIPKTPVDARNLSEADLLHLAGGHHTHTAHTYNPHTLGPIYTK